MKTKQPTAKHLVNKLKIVDAKFAVSAKELGDAIKRVGLSADRVNISFSALCNLVVKAYDKTGRSGHLIGNSLKTLFTRLERLETLEKLESLGLTIRTRRGGYRQPMTILRELTKAWPTLTPEHKSNISEALGGVYQVNIIRAILS